MSYGRSVLNYTCDHCGFSLVPFKVDCIDGVLDGWFCCGMNCDYCSIPTIKIHKNKTFDPTIPAYTIYEQNSRIACTNEQLINFIKEGSRQITEEQLLRNIDKHQLYESNDDDNNTNKTIVEKGNYKLELDNIIGYEEIKNLLRNVINITNGKRIHVLICGAPGTAKTVFLKSIQKELSKQGAKLRYIDCSMLTKSGLFDTLFEMDRIDILLMDEIDKLEQEHQSGLLNMAETGILQQMTARNNREKDVGEMTVIATGNYLNKVIEPLRTRFITQYIPAYTKEQYLKICELMLMAKYSKFLTKDVAKHITIKSYEYIKPINMRDADRIARMIRSNPTIEQVNKEISNISKYAIPKHVLDELEEQK